MKNILTAALVWYVCIATYPAYAVLDDGQKIYAQDDIHVHFSMPRQRAKLQARFEIVHFLNTKFELFSSPRYIRELHALAKGIKNLDRRINPFIMQANDYFKDRRDKEREPDPEQRFRIAKALVRVILDYNFNRSLWLRKHHCKSADAQAEGDIFKQIEAKPNLEHF